LVVQEWVGKECDMKRGETRAVHTLQKEGGLLPLRVLGRRRKSVVGWDLFAKKRKTLGEGKERGRDKREPRAQGRGGKEKGLRSKYGCRKKKAIAFRTGQTPERGGGEVPKRKSRRLRKKRKKGSNRAPERGIRKRKKKVVSQ